MALGANYMLRDQPSIVPGIYFLPEDPIGPEILIPAFRSATSVQGAFGWFTADWISRLAPGLAEYLTREGVAPIHFTVAPQFFAAELEAARKGIELDPSLATKRIADLFARDGLGLSALSRHALDCMSWMIAARILVLKVAVPRADSNYHPKIWLFDDGKNQLLAHGSGNATGHGIESGVEHITVDVSWSSDGRSKVNKGMAQLTKWAKGCSKGIARVVELPDALREGIVRVAPRRPPSLEDYRDAVLSDGVPGWTRETANSLHGRFRSAKIVTEVPRLKIPEWLEWKGGKFGHQAEAVTEWEKTGPPHRGTLSMATGAGKTLTALICATRAQFRAEGRTFLVVISAPSVPLIKQWREEIQKFGISAVTPTLASNLDLEMTGIFRGLGVTGTQVLVVTNNLLCRNEFQESLRRRIHQHQVTSMLIGDEAHTLGARGFRANTPDFFEFRLALSATPRRQHDPDGTEHIFSFFGQTVYEFGLERAIGLCLVPYDYYVHAATLDNEEMQQFVELTRSISRAAARGQEDDDENSLLKRLLIKRRRIVETTTAKLTLLKRVLELRDPTRLENALVYASAKDPGQFDSVASILDELGIRWAAVTQETTARPRELERVFDAFRAGGYQMLLAKKVLDEGVDIPSMREAFIVASSTVEREWVQRRGRVLRMRPGKNFAVIHDFLGLPPARLVRQKLDGSLDRLIGTEIGRAYAFARHARNSVGDGGVIHNIRTFSDAYWSPTTMSTNELDGAGGVLPAHKFPRGKLC